VAQSPQGQIITHKLLSECPLQYQDAALYGIRNCLNLPNSQAIPTNEIASVRMGTTVATNALLEHKGEPLLLVTNKGFKDALRIGYQQRPDLFALAIDLPEMLYSAVIEVDARIDTQGNVLQKLNIKSAQQQLQTAYEQGLRSIAILLMHGYRCSQHEKQLATLAKKIGFTQISASHTCSPLIKFISRGDTTVIDAYLSPILRRYIDQFSRELPNVPLLFMQSNGGLTHAEFFQGKDAILSGPAGGVVGMVQTAKIAGFERLIGFDMGGTSTDVCHYQHEYERSIDAQIAGFRIRAPMMKIHTVAAGGGSILHFDGARLRVGPDSAGAYPGPAAYRNGGELTVTDCNVLLGKLPLDYFPAIFGKNADQSLDITIVKQKFQQLAQEISQATQIRQTPQAVAEGFLKIAVDNMANAIKKISVQRGYDISDYTLCCFGGAGGQHACLVADALGMQRIFLHPYAGVLSAYGMGLADIRKISTQSIEAELTQELMPHLYKSLTQLIQKIEKDLSQQIAKNDYSQQIIQSIVCRYSGSDNALVLNFSHYKSIYQQFTQQHQQQFGFAIKQASLIVERIEVELIASSKLVVQNKVHSSATQIDDEPQKEPVTKPIAILLSNGKTLYQRETLEVGSVIKGEAIISENTGTSIIEAGWQAEVMPDKSLLLQRYQDREVHYAMGTQVDPVMLEIFNNLFMSIAEQMGFVLEKTAVSVNIKERLDFSCAIFDAQGALVANAPHMPVHLGSMSESIKTIINENSGTMQAGDAFMLNAPYNGGTHLPDITVIKPVFESSDNAQPNSIIFYVASRGHHADIGGITPGSIPPNSCNVNEEGILIDNFCIVKQGVFQEQAIRALLLAGDYPVRNIEYNISDFKAQLAACEKGAGELNKIIQHYSLLTVQAYMRHVQDNAEESVRRIIQKLNDGQYCYEMDDGQKICVKISIDRCARSACVDFTGSSPQHKGNLNAPTSISKAAVLYVFRCLVNDNIPLNQGCLKPIKIIIPEDCILNPKYPAAVVAGNVETSQYIVDTLFAALGIMAASQGTMNNVTWGNEQFQYYETLCGGAGATAGQKGTSAVHTHMTNSRLTDPEILEQRFPVLLEEFSIRSDSGGKGHYKGGNGICRKTRFLQDMTANILSGHRRVAPYGMAGGKAGQCGNNYLIHADGTQQQLAETVQLAVKKEDILVLETPGGGGFGTEKD
jgi:5-oxoprolinase (ATP-hydrolysing)